MELFSWILCGAFVIPSLIIIIAYFYLTRNFGYWKKRGVVEITPTPFVGNWGKYFKGEKSPGTLFKYFYDQSKGLPILGIYMIDEPCLLIRDPALIKRIFIKDFNFFSDKLLQACKNDHVANNCLFFINNPHWKILRQKFTNLFTPGKLKSKFDGMLEIGRDFDDYLDSLQLEGPGKEVDVKDLVSKFTTDLIGQFLFGLKCNSLKNPDAQIRNYGKEMFGHYNFKRAIETTITFLLPQFADLLGSRFFLKNASVFFKKVFQEIMDDRINSKVKGNDFIDVIKQLQDNENFELPDIILAQEMVFFAAGFEPPSVMTSFCLFALAKHPEIQTNLRQQINSAIIKNNGKITYEMVTEMKYLDMIILETMRLYPTMPVMDRKATSDYKIEETGLVIEKGTPILVSLLGLHYDPIFFPDPYKFDPDRFSDERKSSINSNIFIPFGAGPRGCIAKLLGTLQVKLGIIYIISRFEVSLLKNTSVEFYKLSAITAFKSGLFLNIRKINANNTHC